MSPLRLLSRLKSLGFCPPENSGEGEGGREEGCSCKILHVVEFTHMYVANMTISVGKSASQT